MCASDSARLFDAGCKRCERLSTFLQDVSRQYPDYHAAPVPSFGEPDAALLIVVWRGRRPDWRPVIVGGLVGFAVHVVEVAAAGWTAYPLLVALNLILPLALAPVAWLAGREVVDAHPDR